MSATSLEMSYTFDIRDIDTFLSDTEKMYNQYQQIEDKIQKLHKTVQRSKGMTEIANDNKEALEVLYAFFEKALINEQNDLHVRILPMLAMNYPQLQECLTRYKDLTVNSERLQRWIRDLQARLEHIINVVSKLPIQNCLKNNNVVPLTTSPLVFSRQQLRLQPHGSSTSAQMMAVNVQSACTVSINSSSDTKQVPPYNTNAARQGEPQAKSSSSR